MKFTEGAFKEWGYACTRDEFGGYSMVDRGISIETRLRVNRLLVKT